jgi:hypothetical protein
VDTAVGGDITSAVTRLTAFAQQKMNETQSSITSMFGSEGGTIDAAKLQVYSQQMSMYQQSMEMAASIQEKESNAVSVWTRMQ